MPYTALIRAIGFFFFVCVASSIEAEPVELPGQYADIENGINLRVELERVGPPPLPYQALRMRLSVENVSRQPSGPASSPLWGIIPRLIQTSSAGVVRPGTPILATDQGLMIGAGRATPGPYRLLPKDSLSASAAFAADWQNIQQQSVNERVFFAQPGIYRVLCKYPLDAKEHTFKEIAIQIHVPEPQGDDRRICNLLGQSPNLARAMVSPVHVPDPETTASLETIVKLYPRSSYSDYARFAIARGYMQSFDLSVRVTHKEAEEKIEEIDRVVQGSDVSQSHLRTLLAQGLADFAEQREEIKTLAREVVFAKDAPRDERLALIRKLVNRLMELSRQQRAGAIRYLQSIRSEEFPYYPYVFVMLRSLYVAEILEQAGKDIPLDYYAGRNYDPRALKAAILLDGTGRLSGIMEALTTKYADSCAWNYSPAWISRAQWEEMKREAEQQGR